MKKKRRLLSVIFLTTIMLYSCKDDFDDNLSLDLINDNVFVDENGNEIVAERDLGFFHRLDPKIQNAIIVAGRRKMKET